MIEFYYIFIFFSMNSILQNLIKDVATKGISEQIGSKLGVSGSQASSVISMLMPALMGGLQQNAQNPQEAEKLASTIQKHHAGGGIFDNISDIIAHPENAKGDKIASHIFGGNKSAIEQKIAQQSGVDSSMVSSIVSMLAPLVMGEIGKSFTGNNSANNSGSAGSMIASLLGGDDKKASTKESSFLTSLLDKDGDGEIMDDVLGMGMNFLKNKI